MSQKQNQKQAQTKAQQSQVQSSQQTKTPQVSQQQQSNTQQTPQATQKSQQQQQQSLNASDQLKKRVQELELKFKQFDELAILPTLKKTLAEHEQTFEDIKRLKDNTNFSKEEIQIKMYKKLTTLVKINKNVEQQIKNNQVIMRINKDQISKDERSLQDLRNHNENMQKNYEQVRDQNKRFQEENERLENRIFELKQGHYMIYNKTLENLHKRTKEFEADQEKRGIQFQQYSHLYTSAKEEEEKILVIIKEIEKEHLAYKEYQVKYKEQVGFQAENLVQQKTFYKQKYEDLKVQSKELNERVEDFKKRFILQSRQNSKNKDRTQGLEKEIMRTMEKKNYLEKEIQELSKQRENQTLIKNNLVEEVAWLRKETSELNERRKNIEDFIMKHLK
eukprot:403374143